MLKAAAPGKAGTDMECIQSDPGCWEDLIPAMSFQEESVSVFADFSDDVQFVDFFHGNVALCESDFHLPKLSAVQSFN